MCGIVGILNYGQLSPAQEKMRRDISIFLVTELIRETETRGKDATGLAVMYGDGKYMGLKMGIQATDFLTRYGKEPTDYEGFTRLWRKCPEQTRAVIAHCRKSSVGNTTDNVNNHPVRVGDIMGIHNGTLTNHDLIFKRLKCGRDGVVDSEAIMRLVHHFTNEGKDPFTTDLLYAVHQRLQGAYTTLILNGNNPYQVAATREGRPMELRLFRPLKMVIIASEIRFLNTAFNRYNQYGRLYNGAWPLARKSDFDDKMVTDSTLMVFNLETPIEADTDVEDLYEERDVWTDHGTLEHWSMVGQQANGYTSVTGDWCPVKKQYVKKGTAQKHAAVSATPTQPQQQTGGATHKSGASETSGAGSQGSSAGTKAGGTGARNETADKTASGGDSAGGSANNSVKSVAGMVYNKDLEKYVKQTANLDAAALKGKPAMVFKDGDLLEAPDAKSSVVNQNHMAEANEESFKQDLIMSPAKVKDSSNPPGDVVEHLQNTVLTDEDIEVIDTSEDPEAAKAAEEFAAKIDRYEDEEEVALDVGCKDVATLKKAPMDIVANNLRKLGVLIGYKKGYADGKRAGGGEESPNGLQKNFRVLKTMTRVLARITGNPQITNVDTAVSETLGAGEEIDSDSLFKIFSASDKDRFPVLRRVETAVAEKENRK
jgi:amidophosphoribosyltransferase